MQCKKTILRILHRLAIGGGFQLTTEVEQSKTREASRLPSHTPRLDELDTGFVAISPVIYQSTGFGSLKFQQPELYRY